MVIGSEEPGEGLAEDPVGLLSGRQVVTHAGVGPEEEQGRVSRWKAKACTCTVKFRIDRASEQ